MKILLITQEFPPRVLGGVGYHAYNLARALSDLGHDVHVVTGESAQHIHDDSPRPIPGIEVSTIPYRRVVAPRVWFARQASKWLRSADALDSFDLLHAHDYLNFDRIPFNGARIQKIHFNLTEKPRYLSIDMPGPLSSIAYSVADTTIWRSERRLERKAIESADRSIANSHLTKQICVDRHAVDANTIDVVHNGVDIGRFRPENEPPESAHLLYLGGGQERKGFHALLDAVRLLDQDSDLRVTVAGSVPSIDTQSLEKRLPLNFVGHVSHVDLRRLYNRATALVHPARYEPFGNVVLESLACGRPVIVSDSSHCGAADLITAETGIVVDPDDASALRDAMYTIEREPERFSAAKCREIAEQSSWTEVGERTIKLANRIA